MGENNVIEAGIDFIGGVAGGTASVYVGQSLDTVKVKMQTFPTVYENALKCFVQTYKQDGLVRGLYAGTVPSLLAQVSENAVLFLSYGLCQKAVAWVMGESNHNKLTPLQMACAGSGGGFFCSFVLCPTELIKCKQQAMREKINTGIITGINIKDVGPLSITKEVIRTEGLRGLFTGLIPTFAREVPGYFFFFGGYELSKKILSRHDGQTNLSPFKTMVCGGMGGMALWLAVFPADVIKSRTQVNATQGQKLSFFSALINIAKNEGIRTLYKGLGPTLIRTVPATGALFVAYEYTKIALTDVFVSNSSIT